MVKFTLIVFAAVAASAIASPSGLRGKRYVPGLWSLNPGQSQQNLSPCVVCKESQSQHTSQSYQNSQYSRSHEYVDVTNDGYTGSYGTNDYLGQGSAGNNGYTGSYGTNENSRRGSAGNNGYTGSYETDEYSGPGSAGNNGYTGSYGTNEYSEQGSAGNNEYIGSHTQNLNWEQGLVGSSKQLKVTTSDRNQIRKYNQNDASWPVHRQRKLISSTKASAESAKDDGIAIAHSIVEPSGKVRTSGKSTHAGKTSASSQSNQNYLIESNASSATTGFGETDATSGLGEAGKGETKIFASGRGQSAGNTLIYEFDD